jgi:hypothetical protein
MLPVSEFEAGCQRMWSTRQNLLKNEYSVRVLANA